MAQRDGTLDNQTITLGGQTKTVNIKVPCAFIIGDMQGGDKMCCSTASYSNTLNRPCRACNVHGSQLGNPYASCKRISMVKVMKMVERGEEERLKAMNQYCIKSSWFDVDFGGDKFGIFSAGMPVEPLHSLESGLIADCLRILFMDCMSTQHKDEINKLARYMSRLDRQCYLSSGSDKDMQRLIFKDGITTLTETKASEKLGMFFTVVVISLTDDGNELFHGILQRNQVSIRNMIYVFQMMLCYWSWLKKSIIGKKKMMN